jgi:hypothetical protein
LSAAAQSDGGSSGEAEGVAVGIMDSEIAFNADGAVIKNGDFR